MCGGDRLGYTALVRQIRGMYYHSLHAEHAITRGAWAPGKVLKLHALRLNLRAFSRIYKGVILTLAAHILYLFCSFIIISTSVVTGSHLLTRMIHYRLRSSDPK